MKLTQSISHRLAGLAAVVVALWTMNIHAQTTPGQAEVRAIKGTAVYSIGGGPAMPLKVGARLTSGATIKTSSDSVVDLFLGKSAGVIRVTESTTLALDKLALTDTGADTVVEVQLNLPEGTILGNVNKLSSASKYEIKMPNGVAGIRGTRYSCSSTLFTVLLDGTLVLVYVPPNGNPVPFTLVAPPAVYFSPIEGVKPAPPELVKRLLDQFGPGFKFPPGPPPGVPFKEPHVSGTVGKDK